jgi:predicted acylesterase/phospholipase RssA
MLFEVIRVFVPYLIWRRLARPVRSENFLFSADRFERWLLMLREDLTFSDFDIPLVIVGIDVESGERVLCREGRLFDPRHRHSG